MFLRAHGTAAISVGKTAGRELAAGFMLHFGGVPYNSQQPAPRLVI